jgi:hypothetical protein
MPSMRFMHSNTLSTTISDQRMSETREKAIFVFGFEFGFIFVLVKRKIGKVRFPYCFL